MEKFIPPHPNDKELADNAKIIHAYGQPKFWNGLSNEQWNKNYQMWIAMGGNKYKQPTLKKIVQKLKAILKVSERSLI